MNRYDLKNLERIVLEVFGGCNYSCQMCPHNTPGRETDFLKKMPLATFERCLDEIIDAGGRPLVNLEGSGEPTLAKDLDRYVFACTTRGLESFIYCNAANLKGDFMRRVIDAGLGNIRISMIGYNRETYNKWMSIDNFDLVYENIYNMKKYADHLKISTYHLILENEKVDEEIKLYRQNIVEPLDIVGYIWRMHNWSGNYDSDYSRKGVRRTCGRPFANELTVRAGGLNGKHAAVVPCCQVLGPPTESQSVLGHVSEQSLNEIWNGYEYQWLREQHLANNFDKIDYCKNCDFLYKDADVLVWTNDNNHAPGKMLGTKIDLEY